MRSTLPLVVIGMVVLGSMAPASSQPAQSTPVPTGEPRPLPPEKQKMILEQVQRSPDLPSQPERAGAGRHDDPGGVGSARIAQDAATTVPTVTTYRYVIVGDQIAIIEPESRTEIQLINR
jgi:hypothetical protein